MWTKEEFMKLLSNLSRPKFQRNVFREPVFRDPCVRRLAEAYRAGEVRFLKKKFRRVQKTLKSFCALSSCLHHHSYKRLCTIGMRRTAGETCSKYEARKKEPVSFCRRTSCIYQYKEDYRYRCKLGRKRLKANSCEHYIPRPEAGKKKKVPACSKSSCVPWYQVGGLYRCRIGLPRVPGEKKEQAARKLKNLNYQENGLVFANENGEPSALQNIVSRHFKPLLKDAGLPDIRLYDLRHSCATLLLAAGENPKVVSERLGHASVTMTLDTYSHVLPDMQRAAAEKLENILFNGRHMK